MKRDIKNIEPILKAVKKRLQKVYGKRLKSVILYGSYARGDANEGSDIDLIILLNGISDPSDEIIRSSNALGDLELEHEVLISLIPFDYNEFSSRHLPVILNAKKEGIRL